MTVCYRVIFGRSRPSFNMKHEDVIFLGSHAAELSENAFPRIYGSRKDVHIFMQCANREHHTCRQAWIYSCLLKLAVSRPHSRFQDEEGLIGRLTNCTLCTRPPRHPYDLHCLCLFSTGEAGSVLGRGVLCTHTLTHVGGRKGAVTGLTAAGLFSFPWSSAVRLIVSAACFCVCVCEHYQQPFLARGLFAQWFMTKVTVASPHNALLPSSQATGGSPLPFSLSWEIPNEFLRPEIWQNLRLLW